MMKYVKIIVIIGFAYYLYTNPRDAFTWLICLGMLWLVWYIVWTILRVLIVEPIRNYKRRKRENEEIELMTMKNKEKGIALLNSFSAPVSYSVNYGYCQYLLVSEQASKVMIDDEVFDFSQIQSCSIFDDSSVVTSEQISTTRVVGSESILDRLLLSSSSRVVNAVNAPRVTTTEGGVSRTVHNCYINIRVNSLSHPIIQIRVGENWVLAQEINAIFDNIICRNKNRREV